jgi:hypothetical protein
MAKKPRCRGHVSGNTWHFAHGTSRLSGNTNPRAIRGPHSAYTDGSVQWNSISGTNSGIIGQGTLALNNCTMSYRTTAYFWATVDHAP